MAMKSRLRKAGGGGFGNLWAPVSGAFLIAVMILSLALLTPEGSLAVFGFFEGDTKSEGSSEKPAAAVPAEYKGKHMPAGWLSDPKVLAAGKAIYEGTQNPAVRCALCHGVDGKPTRIGKGAPDFSNASEAEESNDLWFWRISEGVEKTKMMGWKNSLTEEQRWQVIAYIRTLAHKGAH